LGSVGSRRRRGFKLHHHALADWKSRDIDAVFQKVLGVQIKLLCFGHASGVWHLCSVNRRRRQSAPSATTVAAATSTKCTTDYHPGCAETALVAIHEVADQLGSIGNRGRVRAAHVVFHDIGEDHPTKLCLNNCQRTATRNTSGL
jgi:hypothetical protein